MANAGTAKVRITADASNFTRNMNRVQGTLGRVKQSVLGVSRALGPLGVALGAAGIGLFAANAVRSFASFEQGLTKIATLTSETTIVFGEMANSMRALSKEYGIARNEITAAGFDIVSAGLAGKKLEKTNKLLVASAQLAKAGFADMGVATSAIITAMQVYGDATTDATEIARFFFDVQKVGRTEVESLARVFGRFASVAKALSVDLNVLGAVFSTLTLQGIKAEEVATQIRGLLAAATKAQSANAVSALKELGLTLDSTSFAGDKLIQVLGQLRRATPEQLRAIFPEEQAFNAIIFLTQKYNTLLKLHGDIIKENTGFQDALTLSLGNTQTALNRLSAQWEAFKELIAGPLTVAIKDLIKVFEILAEVFKALQFFWNAILVDFEALTLGVRNGVGKLIKAQIALSKIPGVGSTLFGDTAELQKAFDEYEAVTLKRFGELGKKLEEIRARFFIHPAILPSFKVPPITLLRGKQQVFKIPTRLDLSGATENAKKQLDKLLAQFKKEQILLLGGPQAVAALGVTKRLKEYKALLDAGKITRNEYIQIQDAMVVSLNNTTTAAQNSFTQMNEFAVQAARSMETAFADFFFNAMEGNFKNLGDAVRDFERTIMRLVANLIAQDIAGAIFGKGFGSTGQVGGLLGGLGGLLNFPGLLNLGKSAPAPTGIGKMAQIIPFAHGGLVTQPTIGLLAEREPEIVTPVSKILRGLSEQPPTIINNWNINTNDAGSFREFLFQNKDAVMDVIGYANANNHGSRRFA